MKKKRKESGKSESDFCVFFNLKEKPPKTTTTKTNVSKTMTPNDQTSEEQVTSFPRIASGDAKIAVDAIDFSPSFTTCSRSIIFTSPILVNTKFCGFKSVQTCGCVFE